MALTRYELRAVPVGLGDSGTRRDRDELGFIEVPADRYWGAATQRALNAALGSSDGMPETFFRACGRVKRAAAAMNAQAGRLPVWKSAAIARAADDLIAGRLADHFPLPVWHSRSDRDADTNVNEVLANRAAQLLGVAAGKKEPIDPARDVAMSQSLGPTITASMYVATVEAIEGTLAPRCLALVRAIERRATPATDHVRRIRAALQRVDEAEGSLHEIGLHEGGADPADADWPVTVALIAADTRRPFILAPGGFSQRGSIDAMVAAMAAVRGLAIVLLDVAGAVGGDSEAMALICKYVIGQDQMVASVAHGSGSACVARPLIAAAVLNALRRLGDGCEAMRRSVVATR
jgi:fumarate hydratase class II